MYIDSAMQMMWKPHKVAPFMNVPAAVQPAVQEECKQCFQDVSSHALSQAQACKLSVTAPSESAVAAA